MRKFLLLLFISSSCLLFSTENSFNDYFSTTSSQVSETASITVTYINGQLTIIDAPINSDVEVFSMLGVSIFHGKTIEKKETFLIDLNKGYYIIRVANTTKKISVK